MTINAMIKIGGSNLVTKGGCPGFIDSPVSVAFDCGLFDVPLFEPEGDAFGSAVCSASAAAVASWSDVVVSCALA